MPYLIVFYWGLYRILAISKSMSDEYKNAVYTGND